MNTDTKDKAMMGLSEQERHGVEHMRYQVKTASIDHPECSFDIELIETVVALIDRLTTKLATMTEAAQTLSLQMRDDSLTTPPAPQGGEIERALEMRHAIDMMEGAMMGCGDFVELPRIFDECRDEAQIAPKMTVAQMRRVCAALEELTRIINSDEFSPSALRSAQAPARTYADGIEDAIKSIEEKVRLPISEHGYIVPHKQTIHACVQAIRALATKPAHVSGREEA